MSELMLFSMQSSRDRRSLRLAAPELRIVVFLNAILKETNEFEVGSSRGPNLCFS
jgi:hypothetical protein